MKNGIHHVEVLSLKKLERGGVTHLELSNKKGNTPIPYIHNTTNTFGIYSIL